MSPRTRVYVAVAIAAVAAAGATVGATELMSGGEGSTGTTASTSTKRPGRPPLLLDLGVRVDPEARALRRATALYELGRRRKKAALIRRAAAIFARYDSLEARVGSALTDWPAGATDLRGLGRTHPRSGVVQLHYGLGLLWLGDGAAARAAWRRAKRDEPDSSYAVRAADLLHPEDPIPGLPFFVPTFHPPPELSRLSPPRQFAYLAAHARTGGVREKLLYGVALQRLSRPISAEQEFRAAAALAPHDPEAQVAAAVGLFDKDAPAKAFAQLGPLVRIFPNAPTVRFHLGILLLWLGRVGAAKTEFARAQAQAPASPLAKEARRFLVRLEGVGTSKRRR